MAFAQVSQPVYPAGRNPVSVREFLERLTYTRQEIDTFLDPNQPNWAMFDPVLGYLRRDSIVIEAIDGSRSLSTFAKTGERTMRSGVGRPCRINTYGDSFTEGCQANDSETWQEYLAGHLGEPVRNFGIGGYGVYQAYRRMLREERTSSSAEYIVLNIWGVDDHLRSIDIWRWLRFGEGWRRRSGHLFWTHCNPWAHVRLDLNTGKLIEMENPYPTPQSLYKLCDKEYVYEAFHKDLVVQFLVAQRQGGGYDVGQLKTVAAALQVPVDFSNPDAAAKSAKALELEYCLRSGMHIVDMAHAFARQNKKKLMVLLSYDGGTVGGACQGLQRPDLGLVEYLKQNNIRFVDVLAKHVEDFKVFNLSTSDYVRRYYIGHYKPQGNHFFAYAIKDAMVDWLNPKPIPYREGTETVRRI